MRVEGGAANKPSDGKLIEFLATEDSVEMQLAYWIRDLVNCTEGPDACKIWL